MVALVADLAGVREAFIEYARFERRFRPATTEAYVRAWDYFTMYLASLGQPLTLESVSVQTIRGFKRAMFKRGLTEASVGNRLFGLRGVLRFCEIEGYLPDNPAMQVEAPARRHRLPVYLKQDEALRFLTTPVRAYNAQRFGHDMTSVNQYLAARDAAAWRVLAFCGLRISELSGLDLVDLDLVAGTLTVRDGKGGRDRLVPLLGGLAVDLAHYLVFRHQMGGDNPALFLSWTGNRWQSEGVRVAFNKHLIECGITRGKVTPHTLRHTFATMLYRNGASLPTLQKLLGHADIRSTMVYVHVELDDLKQGIALHPLAGTVYPAG